MNIKTCGKCKESKDISLFNKDSSRHDGLSWICRECGRKKSADFYHRNKEKENARALQWRLDNQEYNRERVKQWRLSHIEQCREHDKQRYWNNRTAERERNRRYLKTEAGKRSARSHGSRRRALALQNGGHHTGKDILRLGECQKWQCWWCGRYCKDDYHEDHLIPLNRGGHNDITNIVISCPSCNQSKCDHLPEEWAGKLL